MLKVSYGLELYDGDECTQFTFDDYVKAVEKYNLFCDIRKNQTVILTKITEEVIKEMEAKNGN